MYSQFQALFAQIAKAQADIRAQRVRYIRITVAKMDAKFTGHHLLDLLTTMEAKLSAVNYDHAMFDDLLDRIDVVLSLDI